MKKIYLVMLLGFITNGLIAQNVNIPDANFKTYLLGNSAINTNNDTEIQVSEATAFTGTINCVYLGITDLTGIEAFTALTSLDCSDNQLTSLDVTQNTALTSLVCSNNQLTSLDVTQNTALTVFWCEGNQLTSLNVTQNTALTDFRCGFNQLTSIDVTQNTALTRFYCFGNQLTSLNVTQNTALTSLVCFNNQLTSLDVTQNIVITEIVCFDNQLTSLDVTQNTVLLDLYCNDNLLSCLNVKNGNNTSIGIFKAENNPNLTCIEVDNVAWSTTNWTSIDAGASFSLNCGSPCSVGINENNINKNITLYPNPVKDQLTITTENEKINSIKIMDVTGKILQVFTENTTTINVADLAKGLYILQIQTEKGIGTKRFIKE